MTVRIKASADSFSKAIQQATSNLVERNQLLPILATVLIEGAQGVVKFTATDTQAQVTITATDIQFDADFSLAVNADKIGKITKALGDDVTLTYDDAEHKLSVKCGKSRFNLATLPSQDFPRLAAPTGCTIAIMQKDFSSGLSRVSSAMAVQDMRNYLNGILIDPIVGEQGVNFVATDGHRLACQKVMLTSGNMDKSIILPRKIALKLDGSIPTTDEIIELTQGDNVAMLKYGNTQIITKLIDGAYPDYRRVIPQGYPYAITFDRKELAESIKRTLIVADEKTKGINISIGQGALKLSTKNAHTEEAEEEIAVTGDLNGLPVPLVVGFNATYFQDALDAIHDEKAVICFMNDSQRSLLVTTSGEENFSYTLMPLRI